MCGLVGMAGDLSFRDEAVMKKLLLLDVFRGEDSTGFAAIPKSNGDPKIVKSVGNPFELFDSSKFKAALTGASSKVFMGHNRAQTRGAITRANAHPFEYDHIVGAHNGTLDHSAVSKLEKLIDEKNDVDSASLIAGIAKRGIKKTIPEVWGAWSLTWYDAKDDSINFLRNSERPMWLAYSEDFKVVYWASEYWMLDIAFKTTPAYRKMYFDENGNCFFQNAEDIHYRIPLKTLIENDGKKFPRPFVSEVKGGERPFTNSAGGKSGSTVPDPWMKRHGTTNSTTPSRFKKDEHHDNILHILSSEDKPYGDAINKEKFDSWANCGCAYCSSDIEWGDPGIQVIEAVEAIICAHCANETGGQSRYYYVPHKEAL